MFVTLQVCCTDIGHVVMAKAGLARNNLRSMAKGDLAFFYHSNCKVPGIVGVMEIVQEHSVDGKQDCLPEATALIIAATRIGVRYRASLFRFKVRQRQAQMVRCACRISAQVQRNHQTQGSAEIRRSWWSPCRHANSQTVAS